MLVYIMRVFMYISVWLVLLVAIVVVVVSDWPTNCNVAKGFQIAETIIIIVGIYRVCYSNVSITPE